MSASAPSATALRMLLAAGALGFAAQAAAAPPATPAPPRYTVKHAQVEPAPRQSGRYTLRGRIARQESGGDLREGGTFVLIGRIAKAGVSCGPRIFRDGFGDD